MKRIPLSVLLTATVAAGFAAGIVSCATTPASGAVSALEGPRWLLTQIGGTSAVGTSSQRPAYIRFVPDSARVEGFGSCNRMSGQFTLAGNQLTLGSLVSTKIACLDNALNAQETSFMSALGDTRSFTIASDTLRLLDSASTVRAVLVAAQ